MAEELASLLEGVFPRVVPVEPESEQCLVGLLYVFLVGGGFHVNYTGGRAQPDLVVRKQRGRVEVPVEVKLTGTARDVDRGVDQLLGYMKGTDWKTGILYVWDRSQRAAAYSRAREIHQRARWGRTVLIAAVKPKT